MISSIKLLCFRGAISVLVMVWSHPPNTILQQRLFFIFTSCRRLRKFFAVLSIIINNDVQKVAVKRYAVANTRVWASTSTLGYKYKYIKNVQVQVQVQGFAKCTWVLPKYIANVLGYNYQVPSTNV